MQRENDATKDCDLRFAISEAAKSVRHRRILLCEEWFLLRLRALLLRAEAGMIECWPLRGRNDAECAPTAGKEYTITCM